MQNCFPTKFVVHRSRYSILRIILLLLLLLAACKKTSPITIGYMGPLSGSYSSHGLLESQAVEMAIDELNQIGGIHGQAVGLVAKDTKGDIETAKAALQSLITEEKIIALIGPTFSNIALELVQIADRMQIPMITPSATNAELTSKSRFAFRTVASASLQALLLGPYIANILNHQSMVVLYANTSYSESLAKDVEHHYEEAGGRVLASIGVAREAENYLEILQQVQKMEPEVLFLPNYILGTVTMLTNMAEIGYKVPVVSGDGFYSNKLFEILGNLGEGLVFPQNIRANYPQTVDFERRYQLRYQMMPNSFSLTAYDATQVVLESLKKAHTEDQGNITGLTLRKYIAATNGYMGVSGPISFDEVGDILKGVALKKVVARKLVSLGDFTVKGRQMILLPVRTWLTKIE